MGQRTETLLCVIPVRKSSCPFIYSPGRKPFGLAVYFEYPLDLLEAGMSEEECVDTGFEFTFGKPSLVELIKLVRFDPSTVYPRLFKSKSRC